MRPLLRPALRLTASAAVLLVAGTAAAQDAGTSDFAASDFFIRVQYPAGSNLSDFEASRFFNKARCDCKTKVNIYVTLSQSGLAKRATASNKGSLEIWIGADCDQVNLRGGRCHLYKSVLMSTFLRDDSARENVEAFADELSFQPNLGTTVDAAVLGGFPNPDCTITGEQFTQKIWAIIDSDNDGTPNVSATQDVLIDLTPPPAPDPNSVTVNSGNQALIVNWTRIESGSIPDLAGYQLLCNRGGELQVFANSTFRPGFLTCTNPDAGVGAIDPQYDAGVEGLNPLYTCSDLLPATSSSFRLKILQNDITYGVAVVSVDKSGNASPPDLFYAAPIKTKSFYDVYRNDDPDHPGAANGGMCALSPEAKSAGGLTGLCAALTIIAIVVARRGRRR
jgi:hypothetical protein